MDKASIVGDAIEYVRELQKQVQDLEGDISQLQAFMEPEGVDRCTENAGSDNDVADAARESGEVEEGSLVQKSDGLDSESPSKVSAGSPDESTQQQIIMQVGPSLISPFTLNAVTSKDGMVWYFQGYGGGRPDLADHAWHACVLQLEVARVEGQVYQLRVCCRRGPGVVAQLMEALEALGLEVLNANLTSFQESIHNTFIAKVLPSALVA